MLDILKISHRPFPFPSLRAQVALNRRAPGGKRRDKFLVSQRQQLHNIRQVSLLGNALKIFDLHSGPPKRLIFSPIIAQVFLRIPWYLTEIKKNFIRFRPLPKGSSPFLLKIQLCQAITCLKNGRAQGCALPFFAISLSKIKNPQALLKRNSLRFQYGRNRTFAQRLGRPQGL